MSAYQVSPPTIDIIVSYLIEHGIVERERGDAVALDMWRENAKSIAYRYHDDNLIKALDEAGPYVGFTRYVGVSPVGAHGCAQCFDYQACEHPGWSGSNARALVHAVIQSTTSASKGAKARVAVYNEMLAEATATRTTAEWMELCAANHVPAMIANPARDILDDPQLKQTLFEERVHETEGPWRAMKPGLRFSKTPASIRLEPPEVGRDTLDILDELGEDGEEAARLHREGAPQE